MENKLALLPIKRQRRIVLVPLIRPETPGLVFQAIGFGDFRQGAGRVLVRDRNKLVAFLKIL